MAILTSEELQEIRHGCDRDKQIPVDYTKAVINAAIQAIEDWFETSRTSISQAINTATSPITLTAAQKKEIGKHWLRRKAQRGG